MSTLPSDQDQGIGTLTSTAPLMEESVAEEASSSLLFGIQQADLLALGTFNRLIFINAEAGRIVGFRRVQVPGVLLGIDFRPANGQLYGITNERILYTIDPLTGQTLSSQALSVPFDGGTLSGFDFNPVADRLRLTGANDQNFRVNVDTGDVIVDGTLNYVDDQAGTNPFITASAYTNSLAGATSTQLFNIDFRLDQLVLQNPPNDGGLVSIGSLGFNFGVIGGFDILTEGTINRGFLISGSDLYRVNLSTGAATLVANLRGGPFLSLSFMPEPVSVSTADLEPLP
ncbi:MAG: DUF4394 domain-containing protein [Synechococcaceae cyanobacterium SM2_3_1]|nr:DUF4394 domain-containing protein [Synechococcaceae cyanobacterium SM2_3_1]